MVKYVKAIKDFSGGLSEVANDNVPDNCLITAKNVVPGDGYGIARASGTAIAFEPITGAAGPIVMMTELVVNNDTHIIAATENDNKWNLWDWYYDSDESAYIWHAVADGDSETDFDPILGWFVYANNLYWIDGSAYKYYDGTVVDDVTNNGSDAGVWAKVLTARAVAPRGRQWFFATPENEVIFSDVLYCDKFSSTNIINISSGVNDTITALHEFNDGLLIFQKRSIYYLTGWDLVGGTDLVMSKLSVESGTKWPKSIKTISNAVLYLGDNGIYQLSIPYFTSSIASKNISEKQASKRLTEDGVRDVYAEIFNGVYYITLRSSSSIKEYRYYLDQKSWWGEYTQQPYCYAAKLGGDDRLFIGCSNGYVLYYDPGSSHYISVRNDGGVTTIPVEVITKGYDVVGGTVIDAKVKRVFVVFKQYDEESSGLTVQVKTDYLEGAWAADIHSMRNVLTAVLQDVTGDESLVWAEGNYSESYWGWIDTVTKMFQLNRKCKRVQFRFEDDSQDEPLMIYGIALQFKKKKAKGSRLGVEERPITYSN